MIERQHVLYRAWRDSHLLYVGLTINPQQRLCNHWVITAARPTHVTMEYLPKEWDRRRALEHEADRIAVENPELNTQGKINPGECSEWRQPPPADIKVVTLNEIADQLGVSVSRVKGVAARTYRNPITSRYRDPETGRTCVPVGDVEPIRAALAAIDAEREQRLTA